MKNKKMDENTRLCKSCGERKNPNDFEEGELTCYDCKQEGKSVITAEDVVATGKRCADCGKSKDVVLEFPKDDDTCNECHFKQREKESQEAEEKNMPRKYTHTPEYNNKHANKETKKAKKLPKEKKAGKNPGPERTILKRLDTQEESIDDILERLAEVEKWREDQGDTGDSGEVQERIERVEKLIGE